MKILWVVNTVFPDLSIALGQKTPVIGGWMYSLAEDLKRYGTSLSIATVQNNAKDFYVSQDRVDYYLLGGQRPISEYDQSLESKWSKIIETIKPDIVHIHGTEYAHGLSLMKICPNLSFVISIQGMISVYARYYTGGMSFREILKSLTFRDLIRRDSILNAQQKFKERGLQVERKYLYLATDIIGRTLWDHDHVLTVNPNCTYHFCNESLREPFYLSPKWKKESKTDHTIFLSQAVYPIKGLHQVLLAVHLLKDKFPGIKLRIAGHNVAKSDTFREKLKIGGYGNYVKRIIKQYNLQNHIQFTGSLNAQEMIKEYLNAHIFICPSSIENSPNSLGEAQLLGVPTIASYVGGIPDMITQGETGFMYRFEEVEMLAQFIQRLFLDNQLADKISHNGIIAASRRHDRKINAKRTIDIYNNITSKSKQTLNS